MQLVGLFILHAPVLLAEDEPLRDDCFSSSTSLLLVLLTNYFTVFHANACIETISEINSAELESHCSPV